MLAMLSSLSAVPLYWDTNTNATAGSGNVGGTWDAGTNWNTDSTGLGAGPTVGWTDGNDVIFSAGTDGVGAWSVSIAGTVDPNSITFAQSGSKTVVGGAITTAGGLAISSAGLSNSNNFTIASKLTGTGPLSLAANGDVSLSGGGVGGNLSLTNLTNDFLGDVTISSGVVDFAGDGVFGNTSNKIILTGGGLVATTNRTLPATREIQLSGGGDRIFRAYGSATFAINGNITGTGNVVHTDGGVLALGGAGNNFSGYLFNSRGTLRLDANGVIPDTADLLFYASTTFNVNGKTETVSGIFVGSSSDTSVTVDLGAGGNLKITDNSMPAGSPTNAGATFYGKISGTGNMEYANATSDTALWDIVNPANNFTGNWNLTRGRLRFLPDAGADAALGNVANDLVFNGDVVTTMNNGGGKASIQVTNGTNAALNAGRSIVLNAGKEGTLYTWGGTTFTVNGQITGGGNLRKEDSGTLLINNTANDYTGETKIINGVISLGASEVLPNATIVRIGSTDALAPRLNLNGMTETITGLTSVNPANSVVLTNGGVTGPGNLIINGSGNYEFGGILGSGVGGVLTMNGSGTQTLSGNFDNSVGPLVVNSGTLVLAKTSSATIHAVGTSNTVGLTINGGTARLGGTGDDQIYTATRIGMTGGTFDLNGRSEGLQGLQGTAGTVTNTGATASTLTLGESTSDTITFDGTITSGAAALNLVKTGNGTQVLTGNNSYSQTTISAGTLQIGNGGTTGTLGGGLVTNDASLVFKRSNFLSINNIIAGVGTVTQSGTGVVSLMGANTYTGGTIITSGTLEVGMAGVLPDAAPFTLGGGGMLHTNGLSESTGSFTIASSAVINMGVVGNSALSFTDIVSWTGNLSIYNWTGDLNTAGGIDRLLFTGAKGAANLANVQFYSDEGSSKVGAGGAFIGNELVPVPESSSVALLGLSSGLFGRRKRRS